MARDGEQVVTVHAALETWGDGREYVRMVSSGLVTGDEARAVVSRLMKGGDLIGRPVLAVMERGVDLHAEARKVYGAMGNADVEKPKAVAVVTPNAPLLVMLSFVLRIAGAGNHTKFCGGEAEALEWLAAQGN